MSGNGLRIESALCYGAAGGRPAVSAFVTAGFPSRRAFVPLLIEVAAAADVVEVGVPFSDPMADGVTIQRTSRQALSDGTTLAWILQTLARHAGELAAPVALMSYVNPLLAYGFDRLADEAAGCGVDGLIVPDLPFEEQRPAAKALASRGVGLIQLVTPATPADRLKHLAAASEGFLYAVAVTGTTGGASARRTESRDYLARARAASRCPVLAGFGVRTATDVAALCPPADGVVVGSALLEAIEQGMAPRDFLEGLRDARAEVRP